MLIELLSAALIAGGPVPQDRWMFATGNELLEQCRFLQSGQPSAYCSGYLSAVNDLQNVYVELGWLRPAFCLPEQTSPRQVRDVVVGWLEQNPDKRHQPAANLVPIALADAFPCGAK